MNYLFLDASQDSTYFQIGNEHDFITKRFDTKRDLGARITELCDIMLADAGLNFTQIDTLSVCTGPGSLTGLRVAMSFMRTLAMTSEKTLTGVDLFSWSYRSLLSDGVTGKTTVIQPTLIDKAFIVSITLPEQTEPALPSLCNLKDVGGKNVYGIRYEADGVIFHEPSDKVLHDMLVNGSTGSWNFEKMLSILPLYVIPSQAERKLEGADSCK